MEARNHKGVRRGGERVAASVSVWKWGFGINRRERESRVGACDAKKWFEGGEETRAWLALWLGLGFGSRYFVERGRVESEGPEHTSRDVQFLED